jgi:hypothetical protein
VAIEEARSAAALSARGEEDPRAALRKAWEKATALRRLWKEADNGTREWFVEAVCFDLDKGDDRKRPGRRPAWREMVRAWVTRLVEANMQGAKRREAATIAAD